MSTLLARNPLLPSLLDDDTFGFPSMFNGDDDWRFPTRFISSPSYVNARIPAVNIKDNTKSYDVEMAIPGFKKKDLKVNVKEGVLTVSSEKKKETEEEKKGYTCREFSYNSFQRSFRLPENVKEEDVKAQFEDGILKLSIPKVKATIDKPGKEIKIN